MDRKSFEELVSKALADLPNFFKERLDNVDVVIENWPAPRFSKGRLLLGLYQGVPKTTRGGSYTFVLPDKITIFQEPIELIAKGNEQITKDLVQETVQHEIAHHLGISDARLREMKK